MPHVLSQFVRGALSGPVGGLAMDLLWYARHRRSGGGDRFLEWEFGGDADDFDEAGPPAQFADMVAHAVGIDLPADRAAEVANVVHWITAAGYGIVGAVAWPRRPPIVRGLVLGTAAVANSHAVLAVLGIYDPPWEYDRKTLVQDVTAHLVYGLAASCALALSEPDGVDAG